MTPRPSPFEIMARGPLRGYVLLAAVSSVSLWTYQSAISWTILELSGSVLVVSLLQTCMTIPVPFAGLPAGIATDRWGPRRVLAVALFAMALSVGLSGGLALAGQLTVAAALGLAIWLGTFDGMYVVPAQVFVGRILGPGLMAAALAASVVAVGIGRITGGPIAGRIVELAGPGLALLPAALGLALASVIAARLPALPATDRAPGFSIRDLGAAARWVRGSPEARLLVAFGSIAALTSYGYLSVNAAIARDLLGAGPDALGVLVAVGGVGAIITAFTLDTVARRVGRGRMVVASLAATGLLLIVLGTSRSLWLTALVEGLLAVSTISFSSTVNLLLQAASPARFRGRVLAVYGFVFFGLLPFGYLGAGALSDWIGVGTTMVVSGGLAVGGTLGVLVVRRRILGLDIDHAGAIVARPTEPA